MMHQITRHGELLGKKTPNNSPWRVIRGGELYGKYRYTCGCTHAKKSQGHIIRHNTAGQSYTRLYALHSDRRIGGVGRHRECDLLAGAADGREHRYTHTRTHPLHMRLTCITVHIPVECSPVRAQIVAVGWGRIADELVRLIRRHGRRH